VEDFLEVGKDYARFFPFFAAFFFPFFAAFFLFFAILVVACLPLGRLA